MPTRFVSCACSGGRAGAAPSLKVVACRPASLLVLRIVFAAVNVELTKHDEQVKTIEEAPLVSFWHECLHLLAMAAQFSNAYAAGIATMHGMSDGRRSKTVRLSGLPQHLCRRRPRRRRHGPVGLQGPAAVRGQLLRRLHEHLAEPALKPRASL